MAVAAVLSICVLLQFSAAYLALRLLRITGKSSAWVFMAAAIILMGVRPSITLWRLLRGDLSHPPDLGAESVALVISILMVIGIAWIGPLFRSIKGSEQALRRSEEEFRLLFGTVTDIVCLLDTELRVLSITPSVQGVLGHRPEEVIGKRLLDLQVVSPADLDALASDIRRLLAGEQLPLSAYEFLAKDGTPRFVEISGEPVRHEGTVAGLIAVARDVTEHERAEKELRQSEARLAEAERIARLGNWEWDIRTGALAWSDEVYRIFALSPQGFGASYEAFLNAVHPDDREHVARAVQEALYAKKPYSIDHRIVLPDGSERTVHEEAEVTFDTAGKPIRMLGTVQDTTERTMLQDQLARAHKLEAIGQLAAGIAHEINTPIQYIGDNVYFLGQSFAVLRHVFGKFQSLLAAAKAGELFPQLVAEAEREAEQAELGYLTVEIPLAIEQSLDGVRRVAEIVRAMKEFSHPEVRRKVPVDINRSIESTLTVARNEWKYVAEVTTDLDERLAVVPCVPGELNQVILNLIVNAADAIAEVAGDPPARKGTISIRTRALDDKAEIRIRDTGGGIPNQIASRVFDPFFTTKGPGKGTGQGLAIAHAVVVERHGGSINFETESGKGTTFIIRLPLAPRPSDEDGEHEAANLVCR